MEIVNIKIDKLRPAEYNPRLDLQPEDKEYQDIKRAIIEFGLVEPLVINKGYVVVGGHQRLKVLKELNFATVPCITVDLDKQKEKMLNIALNKISGDWDRAKLRDVLEELDTGEWDVSLTGFGEQEIEDLMTEFHVEPEEDDFDVDKAVEEVGEPICKKGQLWQLGEHRLMCGDATVEEDVKRLMDGEKADMVFTDPPYAIFGSSTGVKSEVSDDNMIRPFFNILGKQCKLNVKVRGHIYICCDWRTFPVIKGEVGVNIAIKNALIWSKGEKGYAGSFYSNTYEIIVFFVNEADSHSMFKSFNEKGIPKHRQIYSSNVWNIERVGIKDREHFAQKPVEIIVNAINNSTDKNELCIDLFGGSGSTLIACEHLNRKCYMMEIDPIYCDVIIKRWEQYTNKKAVKIN